MSVKRRLQRTVIRGQEGDDLLDEGSESAEYTITETCPWQNTNKFGDFQRRTTMVSRPIRRATHEGPVLSVDYDSASGAFVFILMEDAEQAEIKS